MHPFTKTCLALTTAAALLTGCDDQASSRQELEQAVDEVTDEVAKHINSNVEPEAIDAETRTIPVVDAAALTELRKQAAEDGKVLVIDCWATWCGSCVAMFPKLHAAMDERGDKVMLVSLSYDEGEASIKQAGEFLTEHHAWDGARIAEAGADAKDAIADALSADWGGGALPAVFVYGPDGKPVYEMLETRGEVDDWVAEITKAVDQSLEDADGSRGQ